MEVRMGSVHRLAGMSTRSLVLAQTKCGVDLIPLCWILGQCAYRSLNTWQLITSVKQAVAVYAISLFLPTIINGLGYSAEHAQLLTVPVYTAAAVCCILAGYYSDLTGRRSLFVLLSFAAVFVGFLLAVAPSSFIPGLTYAGCFIATCGIYPGTFHYKLPGRGAI